MLTQKFQQYKILRNQEKKHNKPKPTLTSLFLQLYAEIYSYGPRPALALLPVRTENPCSSVAEVTSDLSGPFKEMSPALNYGQLKQASTQDEQVVWFDVKAVLSTKARSMCLTPL